MKRAFAIVLGLLCLFLGWTSAQANKSGVGPTVLSLPSGPGSIGGVGENVQANLNMGLMSYSIKVLVPEGRGKFSPGIGVSYSSSGGAGMMGIGWSLNAGGSIKRLTVRGLPTYTNEDRFYAFGEIVKVPNSPFYRSRVEGGFARYKWIQSSISDQRGYWVVEYPDGSKGYFGATSDGQVDLDSQVYGGKGTFCWKLRTQIDRNGNRIEYTYFKEGTQTYIDQISWVFGSNNKPLYRVSFRYGERPDPISDGKPGFDLQTKKRLVELTITSSGQRVRSYRFQFEDEVNDKVKLSRLVKVTRYGIDAKQAHPVQFSMKYSEATFSTESSRMVTMPTALGLDFANRKADFLDINGDGLPDVIDTSKSKHVFHINTLTLTDDLKQKANDFPVSKQVINAQATSGAELSNASVQMIDYNGDGFTDMVDAVNKAIYINKGKGQWESGSGSLASFPVNGKDANMRFFDYNGDKAIDVISSNGSSTVYWVSDGQGNWKQVENAPNLGASVSQDKIRFIDINGDGLNDAVQILKSTMRYKKYLGYGNWSDWITLNVPDIGKYELDTKAQFNDINGDGMADMVAFLGGSIVYFVNRNGLEFAAPQTIQSFKGQGIPSSTKNAVRIADMNGNGSRDIVWINSSGKVTYLELFDKRPNLLTEISNGIGQRIEVTYGSSAWHRLRDEAKGRMWKNILPMTFPVVNQIKTWAETDGSIPPAPITQRIEYHDGYYDGKEKKFRGFREVDNIQVGDSSAPTQQDVMYFNVGDQDVYFHGKLEKQVITDGKGKVFQEQTMTWKDCGTPAGADKGLDPPVRFICLSAQESLIQEGLSDASKHIRTRKEFSYDGYGNIALDSVLGVKDKEGDELYTKSTYITPTDPKSPDAIWNLRSLSKRERCDTKSGPCSEVRFYYDGEAHKGLPLGQLTKGNLTRVAIRVGDGDDDFFLPRSYKLNKYGQILEKRTSTGAMRKVEWDDIYQRFTVKETITDAKTSFVATTKWSYGLSLVTDSTNINGNSSSYRYDNFGRLLSISQPGDPAGKPSQEYVYELKAPLSRIITKYRTQPGGDQDRREIRCFDGLGRSISNLIQTGEGEYQVTGHVAFNARGQIATLWESYQQSDDTCRSSADKAPKQQEILYDSTLRSVRVTFRDGTYARYVYTPLQMTFYDENDNDKDSPHYNTPRIQQLDGLGQEVVRVDTLKEGHTITKRFQYTNAHVYGRPLLTQMTLPDGSVKKQEYDRMGRLVKVIDPDRSTMTLKHNQYGLLTERTDARGVTVQFTYDKFGRRLSHMAKDKPETKVSFTYDTVDPAFPEATHLKGMPSRVDYPYGFKLFSYDNRKQESATKMMFMGVWMTLQFRYDNLQQLREIQYPDGRKQSFTYDGMGRLSSIPELVPKLTYNAFNKISSWTTHNGLKTSFAHDARHRIKGIEVGDKKLLGLTIKYDNVGNPLSIEERNGDTSLMSEYTHDRLYRLTQAKLPGGEVMTYGFNDLDNMIEKTSSLGSKSPAHVGKYTHDKKKVHAPTKAGEHTLKQDANGSISQLDDQTMQRDFLNRLTQISRKEEVITRSYYGTGSRRIVREEKGIYTFYPVGNIAIRGAGLEVTHFLNSQPVAVTRSLAFAAKFYDDLAPTKGEGTLTPAPDGMINVADAWLYHASKQGMVKLPLRKRPIEMDLTRTMLVAALDRMLAPQDTKVFLHADPIGNVRAVTDGKGQLLARYEYYPYGVVRKQQGEWTRPIFMGAEWDDRSQMYYYGTRYMNPKISRWMKPDPQFELLAGTKGEFNSYGMFNGNPIRYTDPAGTSSTDMWIGAAYVFSGLIGTGLAAYSLYAVVKSKQMGKTAKTLVGAGAVASGVLTMGISGGGAFLSFSSQEKDILGPAGGLVAAIALMSILKSAVSLAQGLSNANKIKAEKKHKKVVVASGIAFLASAGAAMLAQPKFISPDTPDDVAKGVEYGAIGLAVVGVLSGITASLIVNQATISAKVQAVKRQLTGPRVMKGTRPSQSANPTPTTRRKSSAGGSKLKTSSSKMRVKLK